MGHIFPLGGGAPAGEPGPGVALPELLASIYEFFTEAANRPFEIAIRTLPLREITSAWNQPEGDSRFVFTP